MDYDRDRVDEMTLALMYLVRHSDQNGMRAWKGFDWETLDRLHEKGLISDPRSKAISVVLTDEGQQRSEALFAKHFAGKRAATTRL